MRNSLLIFVTGFLVAVNTFCADRNLINDVDFAQNNKFWKQGMGWSVMDKEGENETSCAKLEYDIKNKWSKLAQTVKVEPESYYVMTFRYRSKNANGTALKLIASTREKLIPEWTSYRLNNEWTEGAYYFYSGKTREITFGWYLDGKEPNVLFIYNACLKKMEGIELAGKSFLRNSRFEDGANGWSFPKKWGKLELDGTSSLDSSVGCIDGKKSLKLDTSKSASEECAFAVACSSRFPVLPGKDYVLRFWAKAQETDTPLVVIVDSYIFPFIPPHWYKKKYVMIDRTLRKYTMELHIPEVSKAPALVRRLVFLKFALEKNRGIVWIDNVSFAVKK